MTTLPMRANRRPSYRTGGIYAITTALLLAIQEPFSVLAAKRLSSLHFIGITQFALLLSVPMLALTGVERRDELFVLLTSRRHLGRLFLLFCVGLAGLLLYDLGLGSAHPIIVAAILNLSPFWAALVALVVSKKRVPVSSFVYLFCFLLAFAGAMIIAWSQMDNSGHLVDEILKNFWGRTWMFAIPVPIFYALSGTLVGHWFADFDESSTIAASFVVSAAILIPATFIMSSARMGVVLDGPMMYAIALLIIGTLAAAAAGRVFYQVALNTTGNDNGFVTMFFLLIPALTSLISAPLSRWIPDLRFNAGSLFLIGLALITASLFLFSYKTLRQTHPPS
jgi:drug/metabolite transporter (DMT)-like permease